MGHLSLRRFSGLSPKRCQTMMWLHQARLYALKEQKILPRTFLVPQFVTNRILLSILGKTAQYHEGPPIQYTAYHGIMVPPHGGITNKYSVKISGIYIDYIKNYID